jgi:hypothetical protein
LADFLFVIVIDAVLCDGYLSDIVLEALQQQPLHSVVYLGGTHPHFHARFPPHFIDIRHIPHPLSLSAYLVRLFQRWQAKPSTFLQPHDFGVLPFDQDAAADDWLPGAAFEELLELLKMRQRLYPMPALSGLPPNLLRSCEAHEHFFSDEVNRRWNPHLHAFVTAGDDWSTLGPAQRARFGAQLHINTAFDSYWAPPAQRCLSGGKCLWPWISSCNMTPAAISQTTPQQTDAYVVHFRRRQDMLLVPHGSPALIVGISRESPDNEVYNQSHTHTMGYFWDAEVFAPYSWAIAVRADHWVPISERRPPLLWVASNCVEWRLSSMHQLMTLLPVDSFGKCLNNQGREIEADEWSQYLFHLAWENSICEDYLTEKFWRPFKSGAVPIYVGAPNVLAYAPTTHSVIPLRAFRHASSFIQVIEMIQADPTLINYYLAQNLGPVHLRRGFLLYQYRSAPACDIYEHVCNLVAQNLPLIAAARRTNGSITHSPHHQDFSCDDEAQRYFPSVFFSN